MASLDSVFSVPVPVNEPVRQYKLGDPGRDSLSQKLDEMSKERLDIPCVIGGKEVRTGNTRKVVMPHAHGKILAEFHLAGPEELKQATEAALKAKREWESLGWHARAAVFLKAADLLAGPFRDTLNAATMLGQSKNVYQAEIDAACELIDFFRYNVDFYRRILEQQPASSPGIWNQLDYRPLEGFVLAITPFNFTAIAANLPSVPALVGNTAVWKPSDTQMLSAWYTMKLFKAAGLPDGVINMVGADGPVAGNTLLPMADLAGVHFTGSTKTFQGIFKTVGENIPRYRSYPRLVGETGGKDFVFAHASADLEALVTALIRGAFEYQGQKCSAASRAYIPKSIWPKVKERLLDEIATIRMGDPRDFSNFMNAVIDKRSFDKISGYVEHARGSSDAEILAGGKCDDRTGYFVEPTVVLAKTPTYKSMVEEIFGPVLTVFVYDDAKIDDALRACEGTASYALTGAIFAGDRRVVRKLTSALRNAAGNFYINDKPTGAVVGQQPFGGGRGSGTNDKAGSILNLYRWISVRTIKETFVPATSYRYPFMDAGGPGGPSY